MRTRLLLAVPFLLPYVAFFILTRLLMALLAKLTICFRSSKAWRSMFGATRRPTLFTFQYSHFCDRVRWALRRAGVEYDEVNICVGAQGWLTLMATLQSSRVTLPLMLLPDGRVLGHSSEILTWIVESKPECAKWLLPDEQTKELSERILKTCESHSPVYHLWKGFVQEGGFKGWRQIWQTWSQGSTCCGRIFGALSIAIYYFMALSLPPFQEDFHKNTNATDALFHELSLLLSDGRRFLGGGDEPSAADITLAALYAWCAMPESVLQELLGISVYEDLPAGMRERVDRWRDTPVGMHITRVTNGFRPGPARSAVGSYSGSPLLGT